MKDLLHSSWHTLFSKRYDAEKLLLEASTFLLSLAKTWMNSFLKKTFYTSKDFFLLLLYGQNWSTNINFIKCLFSEKGSLQTLQMTNLFIKDPLTLHYISKYIIGLELKMNKACMWGAIAFQYKCQMVWLSACLLKKKVKATWKMYNNFSGAFKLFLLIPPIGIFKKGSACFHFFSKFLQNRYISILHFFVSYLSCRVP